MTTMVSDSSLGVTEVSFDALHLSITRSYESGAEHRLHLREDSDLGLLKLGDQRVAEYANEGVVLVQLGIDNDHDEVQASLGDGDMRETLGRARDALTLAIEAASRVAKA